MSNPSSDSYRNPLRHTGQDYSFAPRYIRGRDPINPLASPDIKPKEQQGYYPTGSFWTNSTNGNLWALATISNNLAKWILLGSNLGNVITLSDDQNQTCTPNVSGNIQVTGRAPNKTVTGFTSTVVSDNANHILQTNPMAATSWIVDPNGGTVDHPNGTHTTITAALAVAAAGDTIFIKPGVYNENLTLVSGVKLTSFVCENGDVTNGVLINGNISVTSGGTYTVSGLNVANFSVSGAGGVQFTIQNCKFSTVSNSNGGALITMLNCFYSCSGTNVFVNITNGCTLRFINVWGFNNSSASCTVGAIFEVWNSYLEGNYQISGSAEFYSVRFNNSQATNISAVSGGSFVFYGGSASSGTASAITIDGTSSGTVANVAIDSTNFHALDGAGTINYGSLVFIHSSSNNVTTKNLLTVT